MACSGCLLENPWKDVAAAMQSFPPYQIPKQPVLDPGLQSSEIFSSHDKPGNEWHAPFKPQDTSEASQAVPDEPRVGLGPPWARGAFTWQLGLCWVLGMEPVIPGGGTR
jgi:hypothetical protein